MEGLKGSLFYLVIFTLFAHGSSLVVENICSNVQKIPCDDTQCILRDQWCDGTKHCTDGSDEKYCKIITAWWSSNYCNKEKHFQCSEDGRCFPASVRCDNFNNCADFSDEEGCETSTTTTVSTQGFGEESSRVAKVSEGTFQTDNSTNLLTENHGTHEEPSRIFSSTSPRSDVYTTSEPTPTDYYTRLMQSSNQNGRTNRNGRNPNHNRRGYNHDPSFDYTRHQNATYTQNAYINYDGQNYGAAVPDNYGRDHQTYGQHQTYGHSTDGQQRSYGGHNGRAAGSDYRPTDPRYPQSSFSSPTAYPLAVGRLGPHSYETAPPESHAWNTESRGLTLVPPRSVLYPPELRTPHSNRNRRLPKTSFAPFYFERNYTVETNYEYSGIIRRAKDWILTRRDQLYTWGRDTPRALIALSLITNSFSANITENDLMRKSLKTHLGLKLLRNNTGIETMSTTRLAMYINALLATCQDPRDFWGLDLTEILRSRKNHLERDQTFVNPLVYLSLCLTDQPISHQDMQDLVRLLVSRFPDEISKDLHILATISLACFSQQSGDNRYRNHLEAANRNLQDQKNSTDGSFGSIYSTALAAQAFMSSNVTAGFHLDDTLRTLSENQLEDGSFGDMQATYYIVIALSGRSLLHLRNTQCDPVEADETPSPPPDCPKIKVLLSLRVGHPEIFSTAIQLRMCDGASAFDALRMAADIEPRFKFHYKITNGQLGVHTIANVPSDAERGLYWNLYVLSTPSQPVDTRLRYIGDIRELILRDGTELLYWYLPIQLN